MQPKSSFDQLLEQSELGKKTSYRYEYSPEFLFTIPRQVGRDKLDIRSPLPFFGHDIWNTYELSWLNTKGKPQVAVVEFVIPCTSQFLLESKHFKLYLNSFSNTRFNHTNDVVTTLQKDLTNKLHVDVKVKLSLMSELNNSHIQSFGGHCLDLLDIEIQDYQPNNSFLTTENKWIEENLYSDLLKSNCPVTGQPDWASVQIQYRGKKINHENLLMYIISSRNHQEFHEQCVERIFIDIMRHCQPESLTVQARYTRRGGLDINPCRSTNPQIEVSNQRQIRQ